MRTYEPAEHGVVATPRLTRGRGRSGPGPFTRTAARTAGLLDAVRGVPLTYSRATQARLASATSPAEWGRSQAGAPIDVGTAYIGRAHHRVDALASRLTAELIATQQHSLRRLYAYAQAVAEDDATLGEPSLATRGRFVTMLAALRAAATSCQQQVEAAAAEANQTVDCYWETFSRYHRELRPPRRRERGPVPNDPRRLYQAARYTRDPIWQDPSLLLLASFGPAAPGQETATAAGEVLRRAIDLLITRS